MQLSAGSVCRYAVDLRLLHVKSSPPCKIVPKCAEGEGVEIRLLRDPDSGRAVFGCFDGHAFAFANRLAEWLI